MWTPHGYFMLFHITRGPLDEPHIFLEQTLQNTWLVIGPIDLRIFWHNNAHIISQFLSEAFPGSKGNLQEVPIFDSKIDEVSTCFNREWYLQVIPIKKKWAVCPTNEHMPIIFQWIVSKLHPIDCQNCVKNR